MRALTVLLVLQAAAAFAAVPQPGTQPRSATSLAAGDNQLPVTLQLERTNYCMGCHDQGVPGLASSSPGALWKGSMMANAARDPIMYAALAIANQDMAGSNIGGEFCLRCHSPPGFLAGHTLPAQVSVGNPNGYPCNSYQVGSLTNCVDLCQETAARVNNGYCMIAFDDRATAQAAFKGHPIDPTMSPIEPSEQTGDVYDDSEGLSCAFCHRIDKDKTPSNLFGGNYFISAAQDTNTPPRSVRVGPYPTSLTNCTDPNNAATCTGGTPHPHDVAASALHSQAELCGMCHDVTNPVLDRLSTAGVSLGFKMPIERTFSEWKASEYRIGGALAEACQSCHMPRPLGAGSVCSAIDEGTRFPFNRNADAANATHQHAFAGGNAWLPKVFAEVQAPMSSGTGTSGDPAWFFDLITRTNRQGAYDYIANAATSTLQRAADMLVMGAPASVKPGDSFPISVYIENKTGHKLPTGYPEGRRMWIQVIARVPGQATADPFFQSGAYDDASGVLTHDAQVKIYEVEMSVAGKVAPPNPPQFHFVTNQIVWKDNRIPPFGMNPAASNFAEMAPVGITYPPKADGKLPNWDTTPYTLKVPAWATGDVELTVRLVYQTISKDYVDFLRTANTTNPRGQDMTRIWENHGRGKYIVMNTQTISLTNTMPCVAGAEVCDGQDNDCDSEVDEEDACADMAVPPDDMGEDVDMTPVQPRPSGCGVSVAGADWTDLSPLAALCIGGLAWATQRRRIAARDRGGRGGTAAPGTGARRA